MFVPAAVGNSFQPANTVEEVSIVSISISSALFKDRAFSTTGGHEAMVVSSVSRKNAKIAFQLRDTLQNCVRKKLHTTAYSSAVVVKQNDVSFASKSYLTSGDVEGIHIF